LPYITGERWHGASLFLAENRVLRVLRKRCIYFIYIYIYLLLS
jgi:hypothetical protein